MNFVCCVHVRNQNFFSGGPDPSVIKKAEVEWFISMKTILFQGSRCGPTFSRGGGGGGILLLIPYRNPYNVIFHGEVQTPCRPSESNYGASSLNLSPHKLLDSLSSTVFQGYPGVTSWLFVKTQRK